MTDQLAALRAEVEALRDERVPHGFFDAAAIAKVARSKALIEVLDLIDKHAREDSDAKH